MLDDSSIFATNFQFDTTTIGGGRRQRPLIKGGIYSCTYYSINLYNNI